MKDNSELIKEPFEVQKTKKCLVVLDDVWETDVWDGLRPAFPNRKMGSKVLLTTRNKEIALHIDTDTRCYFYEQRHLNEDESWELLQKKALPVINIAVENEYASGSESEDAKSSNGSFLSCLSVDDEDEFLRNLGTPRSEDSIQDKRADKHELGKEMVKQCGGLPIAITVLGGILMTKSTLEEWEAVHQSFNSHLRERGIGENGRVYELLALSYHDLPYQMKQCFWHLGNFPKYYNIPTRKLYQLWAAEGFISPNSHSNGEEKSIMEIAERLLCELEQRCMVQVRVEESTGRIKSCQLHDFVREICILKWDQENFLKRIHLSNESELNRSSSSSSEATSSSYSATHTLDPVDSYAEVNLTSERESLEHVRSALFFSRLKQRENFQATLKYLCDGLKLLRVLDLERFEFGEELCEAIGNLLHLRYLGLKGSRFNKLPSSIGNLKFLQTLDLRTAFDSYLIIPDVLWKLNQLKHLYLPPSQSSTNKLKLSTLKNLEILKNFDLRVSDFRDISEINKLRKLALIFCLEMENLKAINKYLRTNFNLLTDSSFRIHYNFKSAKELALLDLIVGCIHLRKLDLVGQIEKLPDHIRFSHRLTKLTLRNSALKEDPMTILEKLPNLHFLSLRKNAVIGNRVRCSAQGFARLRSIEFQGLMSLEEWIIEEGSMRNNR
ncbi:hypothetical protein RD792_014109 [Penstemon davidsonii]|uniref:NB-ARC domain-containing protein n=1 Tax=Penstemon davidsonii TaxID=160366 RepID=A0ABR0CNE5_9LAMI|nr:hypothetical protein RD792_014109 [Penstemon davidsonii]